MKIKSTVRIDAREYNALIHALELVSETAGDRFEDRARELLDKLEKYEETHTLLLAETD